MPLPSVTTSPSGVEVVFRAETSWFEDDAAALVAAEPAAGAAGDVDDCGAVEPQAAAASRTAEAMTVVARDLGPGVGRMMTSSSGAPSIDVLLR
jgi:hypothetical protein